MDSQTKLIRAEDVDLVKTDVFFGLDGELTQAHSLNPDLDQDLILDQNIWMLGQNRMMYRMDEGDNPRIIRLANQELWQVIYNMWCYIAVLPSSTSETYYNLLNTYLHFLSHDCKPQSYENTRLVTLTADKVFYLLITCQCPKLIFNYKLKRQRLNPSKIISISEKLCFEKYFGNKLSKLDFSGADFCCDDSLLVTLLPKCKVLNVLCLGNSGSKEVLEAAKHCPLTKLQLEERFPLTPKLPQDILLHYLLGFTEGHGKLNKFLELCKKQTTLVHSVETNPEESIEDKIKCSNFLKSFPSKCCPTWPRLKSLIFGNCRLCREALLFCLLVLNDLQEISIHRIQSDEILNTCERVFDALDVRFEISLKKLDLWAGWAGFKNRTLKIVPNANDFSIIANGYSSLNLQEAIEANSSLLNIRKLRLVGIKNAGPSVFNNSTSHLGSIHILELSGVILTTEELVNILSCLKSITKLQLDYSEIRNYSYILENKKYPKNCPLKSLSLETSYIDFDALKSMLVMAPNIQKLCIWGKTRAFRISFAAQQLFLNTNSQIDYLELYPQYQLDILGLISLANSVNSKGKLLLTIPLDSVTQREHSLLSQSGWVIFPACPRC